MSYGFLKLGFRSGDKIAVWLSNKDYYDSILLKFASARIGLHLHSIADNEIEEGLKDAKGVVFSPWENMNRLLRIDYMLDIMPFGASSITKFPKLEHFIQSGASTLRGTIKLKDIPCSPKGLEKIKSNLDINLDSPFFSILVLFTSEYSILTAADVQYIYRFS